MGEYIPPNPHLSIYLRAKWHGGFASFIKQANRRSLIKRGYAPVDKCLQLLTCFLNYGVFEGRLRLFNSAYGTAPTYNCNCSSKLNKKYQGEPHMESGLFKKKRKNYAQVSNTALLDKNLSLKAKGLYALIESLLSIPNFTLYKDYLINCSTDGKSAFDSAWKELKSAGYLVQEKVQTHKGFVYEYELLDSPNGDFVSSINGANSGSTSENVPSMQNSNISNNNSERSDLNNSRYITASNKKGDLAAPTYRKPISGKSSGGNPMSGESGSKNNKPVNNILENNTYTNNNGDSTEYRENTEKRANCCCQKQEKVDLSGFFGEIEVEKERTKQAYQLEEGCFDGVDESLSKVISSFNANDQRQIMKLKYEDIWEIYYMYLLLKKAIPDYLSECPCISKSPEAYIIGMMKNKIGGC